MRTTKPRSTLLALSLKLALAITLLIVLTPPVTASQHLHDGSIIPTLSLDTTRHTITTTTAHRFLVREHAPARAKRNPSGPKDNNNNPQNVHTQTLQYKHEDLSDSDFRLLAALLFLLVVLPPAVFICIYAPGECLVAIGIGQILMGGILHIVHSEDPNHDEIPWHTSPHLHVVLGFVWILIGVWKVYIQQAAREIEKEEAEERRRKYSFLRTKWEQEATRERKTREREKRRKNKVRKTPFPFPLFRGNSLRVAREYELAPLRSSNMQPTNHRPGNDHSQSNSQNEGWEEDESYMTV